MEKRRLIPLYFDMNNQTYNETNFFFLEHLLKARADLHLETGHHDYDQEVNVYLAGLLNSLLVSGPIINQKPYISSFDTDVRSWLEMHPGTRNEYVVYRDNADFRLLLSGLFDGCEHKRSYTHIVLADNDDLGRVALYYELAASALLHLQGNSNSLVQIYYTLSETISEILQILKRAASTYFDLIERISEGSLYHLTKEIDEIKTKTTYASMLDEFLKLYSMYKENPTEDNRKVLMEHSEKLKKINAAFNFSELDDKGAQNK
jgi:hypothetical protein